MKKVVNILPHQERGSKSSLKNMLIITILATSSLISEANAEIKKNAKIKEESGLQYNITGGLGFHSTPFKFGEYNLIFNDTGANGGISVGITYNDKIGLDLFYRGGTNNEKAFIDSSANITGNFSYKGYGIDLLYYFAPFTDDSSKFFLSLGIGTYEGTIKFSSDFDGCKETYENTISEIASSIGIGVKINYNSFFLKP
ncbi:MAG: porin family protein, partial [Rickettsiales bacterium]|nr:porin family protein [Rickettsiales bacterium]